MKTKSKVLVSALLVIALCASVIAGTTFALFSSEDKVNIAVTSGKVSVKASIGEAVASTSIANGQPNVQANVDGKQVSLNAIVPGDKVELPVNIKNDSTVGAKYRLSYKVSDGYILANGLNVVVNGVSINDEGGLKEYKSAWSNLPADLSQVKVSIELPVRGNDIDNKYQALNTSIELTVEAVQGNGVDEATNEEVRVPIELAQAATADEFAAALNEKEVVVLSDKLQVESDVILDGVKKEIDLNGKTLTFNGTSTRLKVLNGGELVISGGSYIDTGKEVHEMGFGAGVTNQSSILVSGGSTLKMVNVDYNGYGGIYVLDDNSSVVVDSCSLVNTNPMLQAIGTNNSYGNAPSISVKDTTIVSAGTGVMLNAGGSLVIDNCDITANFQCVQVRSGTAVIKNGTKLNCKASAEMWNGLFEGDGPWSKAKSVESVKNMHLVLIDMLDNGKSVEEARNWGSSNAVAPGCVVIGNKGGDKWDGKTASAEHAGYRNDSGCVIAEDTEFVIGSELSECAIIVCGHGDDLYTASVEYKGQTAITSMKTNDSSKVCINGVNQ